MDRGTCRFYFTERVSHSSYDRDCVVQRVTGGEKYTSLKYNFEVLVFYLSISFYTYLTVS